MQKEYDVIVIGAGMTGGWAAKEFCENGYKTLLLERGRDVKHNIDYPTTNDAPWDQKLRGTLPNDIKESNPIASRCYAFREDTTHFFIKDDEHPYVQEKPFDWIKGYQVGGKSLMWARQVQRWSDYDFRGPLQDDFAVDWPIRYKDLEEWYTYVERFIGVSGNKDGLDTLPDGDFLKPLDLSCLDIHFQQTLKDNYDDRHLIYGRCAHITEMRDIFRQQGRTLCQNRTVCERGCPFGGYFNANSTLIPWADRTGNLTLRPHSVVQSITYDDASGKATGVNVIDALSKEEMQFTAKVIFVNAATINTNLILLNSKSERFPNGLGNDNGLLGKYLAFHNYRARLQATFDGLTDVEEVGRRPTGSYIPRFQNIKKTTKPYKRGYAAAFYANKTKRINTDGIGDELLKNLNSPKEYNVWRIDAMMMGETLPKATNQITLDETKTDEWGIPLLRFDIDYDDNDRAMMEDFYNEFTAMFEQAGFKDIDRIDTKQAPGLDIHEMGGARMGNDPKESILNGQNQMHLVPNVFVTDGACMTSTSTQNPSLTFMAMTARAAKYAMSLIEQNKI